LTRSFSILDARTAATAADAVVDVICDEQKKIMKKKQTWNQSLLDVATRHVSKKSTSKICLDVST